MLLSSPEDKSGEYSATSSSNSSSSGCSSATIIIVKCLDCVTLLEKKAVEDVAKAKQQKLADAKMKLDETMKGSDKVAQLKASSYYAACEAELVTGMKPKLIHNRGGGRGRGKGGR